MRQSGARHAILIPFETVENVGSPSRLVQGVEEEGIGRITDYCPRRIREWDTQLKRGEWKPPFAYIQNLMGASQGGAGKSKSDRASEKKTSYPANDADAGSLPVTFGDPASSRYDAETPLRELPRASDLAYFLEVTTYPHRDQLSSFF